MLRVGLIGAGRIAGVHAASISSYAGSALIAISDKHIESAEKLAAKYNCEFRETARIIEDPSIDAVLIAASTDSHSDLIEAATSAGKAVLCEKPVDLSLARAIQCQKSVANTGKPVMIGFNRRFDPNFRALKSAADAGEIGKSELLSITSFDPAPPPISYVRGSGGLFKDMMIHDFDMANYVFGRSPKTIVATGSCLVDPAIAEAGDVDTAVVALTYADGRLAVIKNSRRSAYGYDQRVELLGSTGLLQAQNMLENTMVKSTVGGVTSAKPTYFFLERYAAAYAAEWHAFADAIVNDKPLPVTLDDGVIALAMAEAATRSFHSGRPVELASVV